MNFSLYAYFSQARFDLSHVHIVLLLGVRQIVFPRPIVSRNPIP